MALKAVSLGPSLLLLSLVEAALAREALAPLDLCRWGVYEDRKEEEKASAERAGVACFPLVLFHNDSAAGVKDAVMALIPLEIPLPALWLVLLDEEGPLARLDRRASSFSAFRAARSLSVSAARL